MSVSPDETNPPLIVYANGVLSLPVAPQRFQLISRRRGQYAQFRRGMQLQQFSQRHAFKSTKPFGMLVVKKFFGFFGREALNHLLSVLRLALYVKQRTLSHTGLLDFPGEGRYRLA